MAYERSNTDLDGAGWFFPPDTTLSGLRGRMGEIQAGNAASWGFANYDEMFGGASVFEDNPDTIFEIAAPNLRGMRGRMGALGQDWDPMPVFNDAAYVPVGPSNFDPGISAAGGTGTDDEAIAAARNAAASVPSGAAPSTLDTLLGAAKSLLALGQQYEAQNTINDLNTRRAQAGLAPVTLQSVAASNASQALLVKAGLGISAALLLFKLVR